MLLSSSTTNATYQWKKNGAVISGATSKTYTAKATGTYKCIVTNSCGTITSNGIVVTSLSNTSNSITSTGSAAFCAGDSLMLGSTNTSIGYTYQWYRSNISIYGATNKNFTAKNPGTYKVISTNPTNGCSRISNNSVTAIVNCRISNPGLITTVIDDSRGNMRIFPNPSSGTFTIEYSSEEIKNEPVSIEIVSTLGKVIFSTSAQYNDGQLSEEINLQDNFITGIYFVYISTANRQLTGKFLLQ